MNLEASIYIVHRDEKRNLYHSDYDRRQKCHFMTRSIENESMLWSVLSMICRNICRNGIGRKKKTNHFVVPDFILVSSVHVSHQSKNSVISTISTTSRLSISPYLKKFKICRGINILFCGFMFVLLAVQSDGSSSRAKSFLPYR